MPLDIQQPSPSLNMLERAKRVQIEKRENDWLVWEPGHDEHIVVKEAKFFVCDCIGYHMHGMCSHVTAVRQLNVEKDIEDLYGPTKEA